MGLVEINDSNFSSEVLEHNGKVLVDFWAPWCGPCRMQTPILEKLSQDPEIKTKIVKVNTDNNPETAQRYGISSIPTLILFENGKEIDRMIGVQPENVLKKKLL
ncbi:MAG: thioredoxin [Spirochaetes bacterium]|nr:thioredoxin [Spirochaetota bacterium]